MTSEGEIEEEPGSTSAAPPRTPKPLSSSRPSTPALEGTELVVAQIEARLIKVLRREVQDPYGGLPADDVLARLHQQFPDQDFPGRMLRRLEMEQEARHAHERRLDELERYAAETARTDASADRELQRSWGARAERVVLLLVTVGLILVFTSHEEVGALVLGSTLVGVVGSFLTQAVRKRKGSYDVE